MISETLVLKSDLTPDIIGLNTSQPNMSYAKKSFDL